MGKLATSATFYRRGITDQNKKFGVAVQSNWPIIQPTTPYIDSLNNEQPGVPSRPLKVKGLSGDQEITLSWSPPKSDGGAKITNYIINSVPSGITLNSPTRSILITGLTNGTPYRFNVIAVNKYGKSPPSLPSPFITPSTIPDPPTNVVGTRGNAEVTLTCDAPLWDGGAPITSYTATSNPGGFTGTSSTTNVVVTGLTNGSPYTFTIVATNIKGNSLPSSPSSAITPANVPDPPTNVVGTRGNTEVSLTWDAPGYDGGDVITSYKIMATPGNIETIISPPTTSGVVTGLTNGTEYTFTIVAINSVGPSDPSNAVVVTPATNPNPPTNVVGTPGNRQVFLTWSAPVSNGGSPIIFYTATSNPGGFTANSSITSVAVTGLTNGSPYTFTIIATNSVGSSVSSDPSPVVTPATVPGEPTIGVATIGPTSGSADVSWTAPLSDGGSPIISYTIISTPGNITKVISAPATSGIIDGLTTSPLTTYIFRVVATNSIGSSLPSSESNAVTPI